MKQEREIWDARSGRRIYVCWTKVKTVKYYLRYLWPYQISCEMQNALYTFALLSARIHFYTKIIVFANENDAFHIWAQHKHIRTHARILHIRKSNPALSTTHSNTNASLNFTKQLIHRSNISHATKSNADYSTNTRKQRRNA